MIKYIKKIVKDLPTSDSEHSLERKEKKHKGRGKRFGGNENDYKLLHEEFKAKYPQFHSLRIHMILKPLFAKYTTSEVKEKFVKKVEKRLAKYALDSYETELLQKLKAIFTEKDKTDFFLMRMIKKFGKLSFDELCEKVNGYHEWKHKASKDPAKRKMFESLLNWLENAYPQFHKHRFIGLLKKFAHHDVETAKDKIVKRLDKKLKKYGLNDEENAKVTEVRKFCPHWNLYPMMKVIRKNPQLNVDGIVQMRREELKRLSEFR